MRTLPPILCALFAVAGFAAEPPPDELIEKARQAALSYTNSLPDFICTQVVRRYDDPRGDNRWSRKDTLTVKLTYFEHLEDYKLTQIDGKPTLIDFMNVGGPTTKGEFGTLLFLLFHPRSNAEFRRKSWTTFHKRRVAVYTYKIDKDHSGYRVSYGILADGPESILAPYHGEIYVDPDSGHILHATQDADLPINFPIRQSNTMVDYDYADVGGRQYLLPMRAEVRLSTGRYKGRNEVEFKDYRKFQTDTTITFDKP